MLVTIVLISAIIPLLVILDWIWKPKHHIPTPCRIPILGNLVFLGDRPHLKLTEWARRYGRLFSVHMFGLQLVVVNGYEAIQETLVVKGNETAGRQRYFRGEFAMNFHDDMIFQDISPKWRIVRKHVRSYFKKSSEGGVQQYENKMFDLCSMLVNAIQEDVTTRDSNDLDPYKHLYLFIVNALSYFISGHTYLSTDDPTFQNWIQMERLTVKYAGMKDGQELDIIPWLRYFNTKSFQGAKRIVDIKRVLFTTLKDEFEKKGDKEEMEGLFSALMNEKQRQTGDLQELFDDKLIENILYDIIMAGTSTSTASLYTFTIVMADYPDVQSKIIQEIYSQINTKNDSSTSITLSDRDHMPYTRAVLLELQRFGSFLPLNLPHKTMKDVTIQGVRLPKNTSLITNLWDVHHDEEFWDEPFKFRPERFIDEETGDLVPSSHSNRKRLFVFSAGPRVCIGQQLAMSRLFVVVTHLLKHFKIEKPGSSEVMSDPRSFDFGLVLTPKRQKLRFVNR